MTKISPHRAHDSTPAAEDRRARDWFLRDSTWSDACWIFVPTSALEEESPVRIRWDFDLRKADPFTSRSHTQLLEHSRRLIAIIRSRSLTRGLPQRATTARIYFIRLRLLLRWMIEEGFMCFSELDDVALRRHRHDIASRRGRNARLLSPGTLELSVRLLVYLHRYRAEIGDGLCVDPCPGQCAHALVGVPKLQGGSLPYTPDVIAVPLVQGAIELLEVSAIDILAARERYISACAQFIDRGVRWDSCRQSVLEAVQSRVIRLPSGDQTVQDLAEVSTLTSLLYSACFIVIAYLVGARVSEIVRLQAGCIRTVSPDGTQELAVIVGSIYKHETSYGGRTHEWVRSAAGHSRHQRARGALRAAPAALGTLAAMAAEPCSPPRLL